MLFLKKLDTVLREIVTRWGTPGLAVGLVDGDQIVYTGVFGVQSLDKQQPVTAETIFCTASVSKCFTATAVMQLAEREKISLDASVVDYLPYFRLDDERCAQITIRQMLSHTSGMPDLDEDEYDDFLAHPEWDEGAMERWVRSMKSRKMIAAPGERFSYSNPAYDVLGDVIARVSGKPFETTLRDEILLPAGMTDSTFLLADVPPGRLAVPHLRTPEMIVNPVYPYHRADGPASFLHSSVTDMCRWCITCLKGAKTGGVSILSPAGFRQMWTAVVRRGGAIPGMYEEMGLGWNIGQHRGAKTVSHGGMGFGWTDFVLLLPGLNRAAVVLCTEESYVRGRVVRAAADVLLDIEPQAGTVSWMVPVSRVLAEEGFQAACTWYEKMKNSGDYEFAEDDLPNLAVQMMCVDRIDAAIDVLRLNLQAFPEHVESYAGLAKLYRRKGDRASMKACVEKGLELDPDHQALAAMRKTQPAGQSTE